MTSHEHLLSLFDLPPLSVLTTGSEKEDLLCDACRSEVDEEETEEKDDEEALFLSEIMKKMVRSKMRDDGRNNE